MLLLKGDKVLSVSAPFFKAEGEKRAEKKRKMVTGLVMCALLRSGRPFQAFLCAETQSFRNIETNSETKKLVFRSFKICICGDS